MNFNEAIELARHAERAGADAIAAVPPSFFHYSEDDIFNYYKTLAGSVNIPLIIYYHPAAQGAMSASLIARIFEIDNVTGVKWSSNNFFELMRLKEITKGEMNIINGPDELLISGLAAGADAGIGSTYNIMLPQFVKIYNYFKAGELDKALEVQMKVNDVIRIMLERELIPSVKCATKFMGIDVGEGTYPMKRYTAEEAEKLEKDLKAIGWPFN
jgi:N-acetylneuraminate lyase